MIATIIGALALRLVSPIPAAAQPASARAVDVTALKISAPTVVAELDLGKLKGDLRQVGWAPDHTTLYVQTAEGPPHAPKLRHYLVTVSSGTIAAVDQQPEWAASYWAVKSDRMAPGLGGVMIDVEQKIENMKFGTGSAGAADRASNGLGADNINVGSNVEKAAESQHINVVRLKLYGEDVSEFRNAQPIPGLMFSWGPEKSAAIAFTDLDGRLMLLDQQKHKQTVHGAKDALLPAWSLDGQRLAWVQKSGRRKFALVSATVALR